MADARDNADGASDHYCTGEIWAETRWRARMNTIAIYGFAFGDPTMNKLVIDAMKIAPTDRTPLDGRDSLAASGPANNDCANDRLIWDAFARMGLGYSSSPEGVNDSNPKDGNPEESQSFGLGQCEFQEF